MDPTGPDGAPRADGLDVRWSSDYRAIVNTRPELREYVLGVCSQSWDQGAREHAVGKPNPFWGLDTEAADAALRTTSLRSFAMPNLVQLPPLLRTVIYYLLGVLNAANVAAFLVLGSDNKWLLAAQVFLGALSGLFFGVAASNVRAEPSQSLLVEATATPAAYDPKHDL